MIFMPHQEHSKAHLFSFRVQFGGTNTICAKAPAVLHTIAFAPSVQRPNIEKGKQHVHITMKTI